MRKSLAVLAATALLALTSGCGGTDSDARGAGDAKNVADAQVAAADRSSSAAPLTRENFAERIGKAQLDAGSAHLQMSSSGEENATEMNGAVRIGDDLESSASEISMDLGMLELQMRLVDGVLYVKMGAMTDGKFVKIDLTDPDNAFVQQYGSLTGQIDPAEQLRTFDKALVSFENEGDGPEIDGVLTTKLRLVIDTTKAMGKQSAEIKKHSAKVPKTMEYVLHVGRDDDLLRRLSVDVFDGTTSIDWDRWGETVEVEAPAKSEITDRADMVPGFGAGAAALRG